MMLKIIVDYCLNYVSYVECSLHLAGNWVPKGGRGGWNPIIQAYRSTRTEGSTSAQGRGAAVEKK